MAKPNKSELEVNGRMTRTWIEGNNVVSEVFAGPSAEGEPVSEWVFPKVMCIDLTAAARQAEAQTTGSQPQPSLVDTIMESMHDFYAQMYGPDDEGVLEHPMRQMAQHVADALNSRDRKRGAL